ncbi:MAG: hypothetical protein Ct9H90mP27_1220 [Gammaproteobacteria bacterium]|nr:MAG: hypothetical protein Ct9H90mP27_1220 [Gammaproteobacteria bacterium]
MASARIKITVRIMRKLLLKTEPRLDIVVPAKLMSVAGKNYQRLRLSPDPDRNN